MWELTNVVGRYLRSFTMLGVRGPLLLAQPQEVRALLGSATEGDWQHISHGALFRD